MLGVSNNQLVSLPTSIQKLNQLKELHLSDNKLTELPSELVEVLWYGSEITGVPSEIGEELGILDVSGNPLPDATYVLRMKKKGMISKVIAGGCGDNFN